MPFNSNTEVWFLSFASFLLLALTAAHKLLPSISRVRAAWSDPVLNTGQSVPTLSRHLLLQGIPFTVSHFVPGIPLTTAKMSHDNRVLWILDNKATTNGMPTYSDFIVAVNFSETICFWVKWKRFKHKHTKQNANNSNVSGAKNVKKIVSVLKHTKTREKHTCQSDTSWSLQRLFSPADEPLLGKLSTSHILHCIRQNSPTSSLGHAPNKLLL